MSQEPYIVLARKHRPTQFADVVGQEHIARTLSNAIEQNRIAHAFLFTGARGIGKTSMARILARALNCQEGPTPTPCSRCPSCLEIAQGNSVDVIEIDAASNRGIDEIRDLRNAVRYPPSRERYKVYIIDEVHMLTGPAFNALLKTLEEPPPQVVFIFATTEPHKIPETIRSRCQRYDFRRIPHHRIEQHLAQIAVTEGVDIAPEALRIIAQQSEGCMRDAQSLLDQLISFAAGRIDGTLASSVLGVIGRDALYKLSEALLGRDVDTVLKVVDDAYLVGVNLVQMASDFLAHLRDLAIFALAKDPVALSNLGESDRKKLAELASTTDITTIHRLFTILADAVEDMSRSAYPKLLLEMALLRMTAMEPLQPVADLVERIELLLADPSLGAALSAEPARMVRPAGPGPSSALPSPSASAALPAVATTSTLTGASTPVPTTAPVSSSTVAPQAAQQRPSTRGPSSTRVSASSTTTPPATASRKTSSSAAASPVPIEDDLDDEDDLSPAPQPDPSHSQRWRNLVATILDRNRTVGSLLKLAELTSTQGVAFSALMPGATWDILQDPVRLSLIGEVAIEMYGPATTVIFHPKTDSAATPGSAPRYSVENEEHKERDAELKRRAQVILDHPTTALIQQIFEPTELRVKPRPVEEEPLTEPET